MGNLLKQTNPGLSITAFSFMSRRELADFLTSLCSDGRIYHSSVSKYLPLLGFVAEDSIKLDDVEYIYLMYTLKQLLNCSYAKVVHQMKLHRNMSRATLDQIWLGLKDQLPETKDTLKQKMIKFYMQRQDVKLQAKAKRKAA